MAQDQPTADLRPRLNQSLRLDCALVPQSSIRLTRVPFHQAVSPGPGQSHRSGGRHRRGPVRGPTGTLHAKHPDDEVTLCGGVDTTDWEHWDFRFEYFKVGRRCRKCIRLTKED